MLNPFCPLVLDKDTFYEMQEQIKERIEAHGTQRMYEGK